MPECARCQRTKVVHAFSWDPQTKKRYDICRVCRKAMRRRGLTNWRKPNLSMSILGKD